MKEYELTTEDMNLIKQAEDAIIKSFDSTKHRIAAALLDEQGHIHIGINLKGNARHVNVCAENISLGNALMSGTGDLKTVVAVRHPKPQEEKQDLQIVSPCGICRDLLHDYGVKYVIISDNGVIKKIDFKDLIPFKYEK